MMEHSKWFERIKKLYDNGDIDKHGLAVYVRRGMITPEEYEEICGEPYEEVSE